MVSQVNPSGRSCKMGWSGMSALTDGHEWPRIAKGSSTAAECQPPVDGTLRPPYKERPQSHGALQFGKDGTAMARLSRRTVAKGALGSLLAAALPPLLAAEAPAAQPS